MTVCIASLCEERKCLVYVSDERASFGDFSADRAVNKNKPLVGKWIAFYAGNDVQYAGPILQRATADCIAAARKLNRALNPQEVADILDHACVVKLREHIETKLLRKHGFTAESFLKTGKLKCTPEVFVRTWDRIDRERFSLKFLLCGFDAEGIGHIYVVDGNGTPESYDSIGFWAIGTGAASALSTIAYYITENNSPAYASEQKAFYIALTAKFMAESATDVGQSTLALSMSSSDEYLADCILPDEIEKIRKLWKKRGAPRIPKSVEKIMDTYIGRVNMQRPAGTKGS